MRRIAAGKFPIEDRRERRDVSIEINRAVAPQPIRRQDRAGKHRNREPIGTPACWFVQTTASIASKVVLRTLPHVEASPPMSGLIQLKWGVKVSAIRAPLPPC